MKKAQGLQISTVIIAILGIVVLFILIGIFTGRIQWFGKGIEEVEKQTCKNGNPPIPAYQSCPPNTIEEYLGTKKCCIPIR